jgi:chromosome transmission fidelity protein 18
LKEWDSSVFGRNSAPSSSAFRSKPNNNNGPKAKAVLLSGPPGLGKTTLAHVIASHAGYRPVEVNASDDRSRDVLMEKVVNATEMRTLDGKPNCLIIDEIDGTVGSESRGPIEALVKQLLVTAKTTNKSETGGGKKNKKTDEEEEEEREDEEDERSNKKNKGAEGGKTRGRGKKKKQEKPLMRPIICICNDLYAPQLRKLKEVARVFRFKKPDSSRLCLRLKEICIKASGTSSLLFSSLPAPCSLAISFSSSSYFLLIQTPYIRFLSRI